GRGQGPGAFGGELEEGVERLVLDAGAGEQRLGARGGEDVLAGGSGAVVAVAHGGGEQVALGVQERVVDRPGVDADRGDLLGGGAEGPQALEDAVPEAEDVPVQ